MGTVYQTIAVGALQGGADSVLPSNVLAELGIVPGERIPGALADGSTVEWGYGSAMFRIDGRQWPGPVIFGPDDMGSCLPGATTPEIFNWPLTRLTTCCSPSARHGWAGAGRYRLPATPKEPIRCQP